ncbi:hypothetical protein [Hymenobacter coalescens]
MEQLIEFEQRQAAPQQRVRVAQPDVGAGLAQHQQLRHDVADAERAQAARVAAVHQQLRAWSARFRQVLRGRLRSAKSAHAQFKSRGYGVSPAPGFA